MSPMFLILYAVIVTLVLTLFMPRLRHANPRLLRLSLAVGIAVLIVVLVLRFV